MQIDLVAIDGRYRGVSRPFGVGNFLGMSHKEWKEFWPLFEKYTDWMVTQENCFSGEILSIMIRMNRWLKNCEIILFSEAEEQSVECVHFLGFDVFGANCQSAIQTGNRFDKSYEAKLNEFGLFSSYSDADDFCRMWQALIEENCSPWEEEHNPRPHYIWKYISKGGAAP